MSASATETFVVNFVFGYCGTLGCEEQDWTREEIAIALGSKEWKIEDGVIWCRMYDTYTEVFIEGSEIELFTDEEMKELEEVH